MKLVSVIVPTYGGGENLIKTIDSVINQDYENLEIIVIDDNGRGSSDQLKTAIIIKKYLIKYDFLSYIVHENNCNGAKARNTGFNYSKGDYIALLDDDDEYLKSKISSQVNVLENLNDIWGMAYCSYEKYRNNKHVETVSAKKSGEILYNILMHDPSATSGSLLIRREVYEKIGGFDESFERHQDWEFTARVASLYNIANVEEVYLTKHLLLRNTPKTAEKIKQHREKYLDKIDPLTKTLRKNKRELVIYYNSFEGVSSYFWEQGIKKFFKEYNRMLNRYVNDTKKRIMVIIIIIKIREKVIYNINKYKHSLLTSSHKNNSSY